MKSDISPTETPVVESISGGSLNGDSPSLKVEKRPLTADKATEIALDTIDEEFTIESDNSPYPEVRANVPNTDDVDLPVNTVRMWFLGIVFTMVRDLSLFPTLGKESSADMSAAGIRHQPVLLHAVSQCNHHLTRGSIAELPSWMPSSALATSENVQGPRPVEFHTES
jgi:hypothetical protein